MMASICTNFKRLPTIPEVDENDKHIPLYKRGNNKIEISGKWMGGKDPCAPSNISQLWQIRTINNTLTMRDQPIKKVEPVNIVQIKPIYNPDNIEIITVYHGNKKPVLNGLCCTECIGHKINYAYKQTIRIFKIIINAANISNKNYIETIKFQYDYLVICEEILNEAYNVFNFNYNNVFNDQEKIKAVQILNMSIFSCYKNKVYDMIKTNINSANKKIVINHGDLALYIVNNDIILSDKIPEKINYDAIFDIIKCNRRDIIKEVINTFM